MSIIGVISDSHDDMTMIRKAVEVLNSKGVSLVVHAGDVVSPFTFEVLNGLNADFRGVFGNNDGDKVLLTEKSSGRLQAQPMKFVYESRRFVVVHEPHLVDSLAGSGDFDVVIYGHTHIGAQKKIEGTLVLNPGKLARLHKGVSSLALLDTETLGVETIELQDGQ